MCPTVTSTKKAQQSQRTREVLLSKCLLLFSQRGFASTSIDDIAHAAGVTKGAMYWHFKNKNDLFLAMLARIRQRWQEVVLLPVSNRPTPSAQINHLFDCYAELLEKSPEICLFLQQVLLDQHNKRFSAQVAKVFAKTARFIATIIEDGKTSGSIRTEVDSQAVAHLIIGMLSGASQQAVSARAHSQRSLILQAKEMIIDYLKV